MTILTLAKSEDRVYRAADTLDGLWAEAEQLGRVELRTPMFSSGENMRRKSVFAAPPVQLFTRRARAMIGLMP
jgi:hypothetical protein